MDSPEAGRAASEEAVLDALAEDVARAARSDPSDSPLPAPDGPA